MEAISKDATNWKLYVDPEGVTRDSQLEHLFDDCFFGHELDKIFANNFRFYYFILTDTKDEIADNVFTDVAAARAFVCSKFGVLHVREIKDDDDFRDDGDYAHCKWWAQLASPFGPRPAEPVVAPTELHAILLSAVNLYRHASHKFISDRFGEVGNNLPI
jgi:hypothetical protein